jgi:hypothetical protein
MRPTEPNNLDSFTLHEKARLMRESLERPASGLLFAGNERMEVIVGIVGPFS